MCGLLGPNGAGKTTTLRVLMGLERPSAGTVRLFGTPVRPGSPALARVGALIEEAAFVPHLSGLTNLRLWWEAGGGHLRDADLDGALGVAGLGDAIDRKVRTYSQGMKQRLGFARLLLGRPELLVLDEPTNGLDPGEIREIRELIGRLTAGGATVLLSSHHLSEVEQVCTDLVVMNRGRLIRRGSVSDLIGASGAVYVEVDDRERGRAVLSRLPGVVDRADRRATGSSSTCATGAARTSRRRWCRPGCGSRRSCRPNGSRTPSSSCSRRATGRRRGARRRRPRWRRDRARPHRVREGGRAHADAGGRRPPRRAADADRRRHQRPGSAGPPETTARDCSGWPSRAGCSIPAAVLSAMSGFLLVVVAGTFAGDSVASDAAWGNLRYLLMRPVPRGRLLVAKAFVAGVLIWICTILVALAALVAGVILFGSHAVTVPSLPGVVNGFELSTSTLARTGADRRRSTSPSVTRACSPSGCCSPH